MTFEAALGIAAITLSVVALALSIVFFLLSNGLFVRMNETEVRIQEIGRSTAEKITLVVEKAIEFWTRPTKEDQAAWETEVREIKEQVASLSQDKKVTTAGLESSLEAITARLARIETDMAPRGPHVATWDDIERLRDRVLTREARRIAAMGRKTEKTDAPSGQHPPSPAKPLESK